MSTEDGKPVTIGKRVADLVAFAFVIVILVYAASGPMNDFVRWVIESTTQGWEELSRRQQRLAFRGGLYA